MKRTEPIPGPEIKQIRKALKLTQEALAKVLHITPVTLCRWERGERVPQEDNRRKLAKLKAYADGLKST